MIFAANLGNTSVTAGVQADGSIRWQRFSRELLASRNSLAEAFRASFGSLVFDAAVLSSVAPQSTAQLVAAVKTFTGLVPLLVETCAPFHLDLGAYDRASLGVDRALACEAALDRFHPPFAVVDLGTATTVNLVEEGGCFAGGLILPGIQMGLNALSRGTAQLPAIRLEGDIPLAGLNTRDCLAAGAVQGTAALIEGYLAKAWRGRQGVLILTGGHAGQVAPHLDIPWVVIPDLVLQGLCLLQRREQAAVSGSQEGIG